MSARPPVINKAWIAHQGSVFHHIGRMSSPSHFSPERRALIIDISGVTEATAEPLMLRPQHAVRGATNIVTIIADQRWMNGR